MGKWPLFSIVQNIKPKLNSDFSQEKKKVTAAFIVLWALSLGIINLWDFVKLGLKMMLVSILSIKK